MTMFKRDLLVCGSRLALVAASVMILTAAPDAAEAQGTQAQGTQGQSQAAPTQAAANQPARQTGKLEEIIVTGSRIARPAEDLPIPVTVVNAETMALQGITSVGDAVAKLPALLNTANIDQSLREVNGVPGRVSVNLRGLGPNRTLVLVDGRRHVAGTPGSASVDISTIPTALVERVDVQTGGTSAVYGSDAVTGVVNFIMKRNFEGIDITLQNDGSTRGDGQRVFGSVAIGENFGPDDRANLSFSASYDFREELKYGDRPWSRNNGVAAGLDYTNPALFVQTADMTPAMAAAGITPGRRILGITNPAQRAALPQSLIDRASRAPARAFGRNPVWNVSSTAGLIGLDPTGTGGAATNLSLDLNGNGTADCQESLGGRVGFGCWIVDKTTGQVRPFRDGIFAGSLNSFGGDGAEQVSDRTSLSPESESGVLTLSGNYDLSQHFRPFFDLKYARNETKNQIGINSFDDQIRIGIDNPFIPGPLRQFIDSQIAANPALRNTYRVYIGRDNLTGVRTIRTNTRENWRAVGGFDGEFDNGWTYELSANYGKTRQVDNQPGRLEDRWHAAIDVITDPATGRPVCRSTLFPNALPPGGPRAFRTFTPGANSLCRPLNLFGVDAPSAEATDFVTHTFRNVGEIDQTVFAGTLSGDLDALFTLPGGSVKFATGAEYRKETSDFRPDEYARLGYGFQGIVTSPVSGEFDVKEAFLEVDVPLLRDLPLVDFLSVNGAVRFGDYSTVGNVNSWQASAVYAPFEDVRFRGNLSRTVRAPNINELFTPLTSFVFRPNDPCDVNFINRGPNPANRLRNCRADGIPAGFTDPLTARIVGLEGGNANLKEETSDSYTFGVVLTPTFLSGLTVTADYWDIRIEDAIAFPRAQEVIDACYDSPSLDNQFCRSFTRNRTAGSPTFLGFTSLTRYQLNYAAFEASGVDLAFSYDFELADLGLGDFGGLSFAATVTWLENNTQFLSASDPNARNPELRERNFPRWAANPRVTWNYDAITLGWAGYWRSNQLLRGVEVEDRAIFENPEAGWSWVHDIQGSYAFSENLSLTVGLNNVGDVAPFATETNDPAPAIGRSYFVRLNARF